jgi:LemA protein
MSHSLRFVRRPVWLMLALGAAVALSGCSYNQFTSQEEGIKGAWGEVQNQLQRRNDLIPSLVNTVKGVAAQEQAVFGAVAASREKLAGATTPADTIAAANEQSSALSRLLAIVENYPQLKSDAQFARLMDELAGTENRIAVERKRYNDTLQDYNTYIQKFPNNIFAGWAGFKPNDAYFAASEGSRQAPTVNFAPPAAAPQTAPPQATPQPAH